MSVRTAFTLIELLVVIANIEALLLPAWAGRTGRLGRVVAWTSRIHWGRSSLS